MFCFWKYGLSFLLFWVQFSTPFTLQTDNGKGDCNFVAMAGQLMTIHKSKYRHCKCDIKAYQNVSSPAWLLNSGHRNHNLQALALDKEAGDYHVNVDSSVCLDLSIIPLNSTDPSQFKCNLRWPTLAAIILDVDLSDLDPRQRIALWNSLKSNIKGAAGLRILEDVASFEKSIFVLANGLGNSDGRRKHKGVAVVWQIGCGSVELRHLKTLQWLEKSCLIGEFSELIGGYPVEMWLVADLYDREKVIRMKREALWQRSKLSSAVRPADRIRDSMFSGTLIEGSGLSVNNPGSGDKPKFIKSRNTSIIPQMIHSTTTSLSIGPSTPYRPIVRRNLSKVTLTIRQINNFKIPRETFYDPQQGYSPTLKIIVFLIMPISEKQKEIGHNDSYWISYDKDLQNIRFLPIPSQIGSHRLLLCAIDKDDNKVCEPLVVEVGPSAPIVKITVLQIPAGALWTYEMPSHWLDGITFNSTADLTFVIEGDAIFCWDESKALIQVVTEAVESRILKIIFNITNPKEYQTLKYEFTLAVSDVSPISNIMSDAFQIRLRWTGPNLYPLNSIKTFLSEFAAVLKSEKIDSSIDPDDLLIYRVLHNRDFKMNFRDTSPDDILSLQIVFRPTRNASCERAALRNMVPVIKSRQTLSYFYIDMLTTIRLKGRCNHAQTLTTTPKTTYTVKSTPTKPYIDTNKPPVFYPEKLIGSTYDVQAGSAFLININVKEAINEKLVRYLSLIDNEGKNVTDNNWVGLSSNGTFIFGMPLKQHVRKESYNFWIYLYTVTVHVLKAPVSINVGSSIWTSRQINHIIKLKLKLTDSLTDESIEKQKINSLKFRIKLTQEIGKVLKPNCQLDCAMDVVVFDLKIIQKSLLLIEWSHLPVLDADGDLKEPGLQCPWNNLKYLFKSINGISNYPIGPQTIQQVPAQTLSEGLQNAQIGTVVGLSIERFGPCTMSRDNGFVSPPETALLHNITAFCGQGFRVPIKNVQGDRTSQSPHAYVQLFYDINIAVPKTHWISVSASQQFIYGLPMLIHSTSRREYVLQLFPQNGKKVKSQFIVTVLPNPFQPTTLNHDITMRMAFISHATLDENIINGLDLRWKVAAALDSYLRPECSVSTTAFSIPECAWRLDVIVFEIGRVETSSVLFDIKWSLRSLLQLSSISSERKIKFVRVKRQNTCPENRLLHLKRLLYGENNNGPEPLQKLQIHLRTHAGVKLNTIDFQRRGPCNVERPEPRPSNRPITKPQGTDDSQKMFLITTVIPVCAFTICILFVALMIALCMKRRNYSGYMKASQNNQLGPGSPVILPDEIDRSSYPPSKPLILPHEKPPLPPPDYNHDNTTSFVPMTSCSYRSPSQTMTKMTNGLEMAPSTFGRQQTPSIRSSPHSHDRFPHGVYN